MDHHGPATDERLRVDDETGNVDTPSDEIDSTRNDRQGSRLDSARAVGVDDLDRERKEPTQTCGDVPHDRARRGVEGHPWRTTRQVASERFRLRIVGDHGIDIENARRSDGNRLGNDGGRQVLARSVCGVAAVRDLVAIIDSVAVRVGV